MWELDHKEGWAPKNWCFWIVVLEKTLESPLDCKGIPPIHPKGNQPWIFSGRTDAEAEAPILLATWCKELTHLKRPWCWERLKMGREGETEDEMVGWHHWLNEHEFEQALVVGDGQGSMVCCSPWGHSQTWLSDQTELNWTEGSFGLPLWLRLSWWWGRSCYSHLWVEASYVDRYSTMDRTISNKE